VCICIYIYIYIAGVLNSGIDMCMYMLCACVCMDMYGYIHINIYINFYRDIIATAHRIDHRLVALDQEYSLVKNDEQASKIVFKRIKEREKALFGVYQQVAVHFADLHDTPGTCIYMRICKCRQVV
jgi:hypothetical protein